MFARHKTLRSHEYIDGRFFSSSVISTDNKAVNYKGELPLVKGHFVKMPELKGHITCLHSI